MSEQLSAEERAAGHGCCACFTHNDLDCCNAGHAETRDALAAILRTASPASSALSRVMADAVLRSPWMRGHVTARAASRDARLAAVEALATEFRSVYGDNPWVEKFRAALHPDPSEAGA